MKSTKLTVTSDLLCPLLRKTFGDSIRCTLPDDAFTSLSVLSERFASSATYQVYGNLVFLQDLVAYIQEKVCAGNKSCKSRAERLEHANYLDFDYDTITQSVVLDAFWHESPRSKIWDEEIDTRQGAVKVEVGVLANEKPTQPEEISLGGFLAALGEDKKPSTYCLLTV